MLTAEVVTGAELVLVGVGVGVLVVRAPVWRPPRTLLAAAQATRSWPLGQHMDFLLVS